MKKCWVVGWLSCALAASSISFAQTTNTGSATAPAVAKTGEVVGAPVANKIGPKLFCSQPVHNFGTQPTTTSVAHTFVIENQGDEVLVVDQVKAGCGCTVAKITNRNIAPGESSEITAKLNLRGRPGHQNKQITVVSNDPKQKRYILRLTGTGIREIDAPSMVNLGNIPDNRSITKTIKVKGNIEQPFNITELKTVHGLVEVEMTTVTEGKEYAITLTVPEGSKKGHINDRLEIKTDYAKLPRIVVRLTGRVVGKIVVSPDRLVLEDNPDRKLTRHIMVGTGTIKDFNVLDVVWPGEEANITPRKISNGGTRITFSNIFGSKELNGKHILIKTDVPTREEIKIPILIRPKR